jgi:hypothetical protein
MGSNLFRQIRKCNAQFPFIQTNSLSIGNLIKYKGYTYWIELKLKTMIVKNSNYKYILDEKVFDLLFLKTDRYVEFKILLTN